MLCALLAAPALAQPPGAQPKPLAGGNLIPGSPGSGGAANQPTTFANGLSLPPGYRPRTPPPQAQPQPSQPARPASGSFGSVMYFQKQADALTATGGGLPVADGVAQSGGRAPAVPVPVPDAAPARVLPAPVATAPTAVPPPAAAIFAPQPEPQPPLPKEGGAGTTTAQKQEPIKDVDPKLIRLPPREKIFGVAYNDPELERAIMDEVRSDLKRRQEYNAILEKDLVFPQLPVVNQSGAPYQPKTLTYEPRKLFIEPGYVVHRRLHFEQMNAERGGWDMGPLSTVVSVGQFYRDALMWPAKLTSGCTYGFWDTNAGKCLPGSPTPLYLYPPNLTVTGGLAEAGIITGFSFLFP